MQPKTRKILFVVALAAGGLCLLAFLVVVGGIALAPRLYTAMLSRSSLQVNTAAPDFELGTLSGETVRLSQFRGQPVLLTFGASWCPDCRREAPLVQALHAQHPELVILLIDVQEDRQAAQAFVDDFGIAYPVALDLDGAVNQQYQVLAIPTELFIDAQGVIKGRVIEQVNSKTFADMLRSVGIEP